MYTQFSLSDILTALPGKSLTDWVEVNTDGGGRFVTQEYVYEQTFGDEWPTWSIRVYTGVDKRGDKFVSRGCGEDAIRFVLFDMVSGKPCGKTSRVNRTGTYESLVDRFAQRYQELLDARPCEEAARCPVCGAATVERENRRTKQTFRGCLNYPECHGPQPRREASPKSTTEAPSILISEPCPF